ncbi:MAG: sulfurtransferase [Flavobacteriales bacterium]|nr:sulfurtransferase [Flavobacteriales bacterium]
MNWRIDLIFICAALSVVSCGQQSKDTKVVKLPKMQELKYASTRYLIEPEELLLSLNQGNGLQLIDVRKRSDYLSGHIAGAHNLWRDQITDTSYNYGGMMPTKSQVETLLGSLGILPSDTLVIYDNKAEVDAARLWWILKNYGHKNMKLLNGGLRSWQLVDSVLYTKDVKSDPVEYRFEAEFDKTFYASHQQVNSMVHDPTKVLLDTRSVSEFTREIRKEGAASAGRIPGSLNLDWSEAVDYNGNQKFLSAQQLKTLYLNKGIDGSKPVTTYCHSGVRSAHTLFVLTELLGYSNVTNYDGSWTEWSHLLVDTVR